MKFKCPNSQILAAFVTNDTLKRPKRNFLDQNDCWVKIIKGERRVESLRCGAAMVTKIVKNTKNKYRVVKQQKCPLKKTKKTLYLRSHF